MLLCIWAKCMDIRIIKTVKVCKVFTDVKSEGFPHRRLCGVPRCNHYKERMIHFSDLEAMSVFYTICVLHTLCGNTLAQKFQVACLVQMLTHKNRWCPSPAWTNREGCVTKGLWHKIFLASKVWMTYNIAI